MLAQPAQAARPGLARRLGSRSFLLPTAALLGALALVLADIAARSVREGTELPVGVITGVVGGPVFLVMLWRRYGRASI